MEQVGHHGRAVGQELLVVVQHQQHVPVAEVIDRCVERVPVARDSNPERVDDDRRHEPGILDRRQRYEVHAVAKVLHHVGGQLQAEPGLAYAAGPGQGEQPRPAKQPLRLRDVGLATDEARELRGEVVRRRVQSAQSGKAIRCAIDDELVQALGSGEVFQAMGAQVAQREADRQVLVDEGACGLGHDDLAAVRRARDTGGVVDVQADVLLSYERSFTRVQPHANTKGDAFRPLVLREVPLRVCRRLASIDGAFEDAEERISLGAQLSPSLALKRRSQDRVVVGLRLYVALAYFLHEAGRSLDVGEQERDGAGRKRHWAVRLNASTRSGCRNEPSSR